MREVVMKKAPKECKHPDDTEKRGKERKRIESRKNGGRKRKKIRRKKKKKKCKFDGINKIWEHELRE